MYDLFYSIIGYTQSTNYNTTTTSVCLYACGCVICVGFVVMLDWLRLLYRSLIYKLK